MTERTITITETTAQFLLRLTDEERDRPYGHAFTANFECARKELQDKLVNIDD